MRVIDPALFSPYENELLAGVQLGHYAFSLCGGPCAGLFRIENSEMLVTLVKCCVKAGYPYKVLGGMTNILVSDEGFDGIILLNRKGTVTCLEQDDGSVILKADSGAAMAAVVRFCIENSISGMEWASGLPGTVGGAVYGNAGAFGSEIAKSFCCGSLIDEIGEIRTVRAEEMNFAYRSSILKQNISNAILLDASFRLEKGEKEKIAALGESCKEKRRTSQPVGEHSLGSVFKNPEGESAGKLIQAAGLKGVSIGKAEVSMKHANFITTNEGVTADDYHRLVKYVQNEVFEQFRVLLEPEIELFGFGA